MLIENFNSKAFENPEDVTPTGELKKSEDVERVRRAHLNDLENIPAFLIAALMYVMTEPQPDVALWLIRIAVIARILHTIVSHQSKLDRSVSVVSKLRSLSNRFTLFTQLGSRRED